MWLLALLVLAVLVARSVATERSQLGGVGAGPGTLSSQGSTSLAFVTAGQVDDATKWIIHGERVVDDSRRGRLSIASVELPDGTKFEQYVLRLPKSATVVVVNDDAVLMMWRHRFVIDRWVWELPGGYVDPDEDPGLTAAREVEEETGWRPLNVQPLVSFQPMVSTIDSENLVFWAEGAEPSTSERDVNEAAEVAWIPLADVSSMISRGEIVGSTSVVALLAVEKEIATRR